MTNMYDYCKKWDRNNIENFRKQSRRIFRKSTSINAISSFTTPILYDEWENRHDDYSKGFPLIGFLAKFHYVSDYIESLKQSQYILSFDKYPFREIQKLDFYSR